MGSLDDAALVATLRAGGTAEQTAIARRPDLSPALCDALADVAAPIAVAAMLENDGARIGRPTLARLVERSRDVIAFRVPLLRRRELDTVLAARLYTWVSPPLREFIARSFPIDTAVLDRTRQERDGFDPEARRAAAPSSMVECLRQGQNLSFEASFARMVGLRITAVRRILEDRAGDRLAVACRACGFTSQQFQDAYRLIQSTMTHLSPRAAAAGVPRLASLYERIDPDEARQTLKRWRREISDSPDQALLVASGASAAAALSSAVNS
ncbi:MAG: DUF2336 domain-containing protein [Alphaproteobacteria bacterium]|nr:DUF2336 domain-containing protein [Alphaproteobacteria bacterium]